MAGEQRTSMALRTHVQVFVRRFGLLADDRTPCGQPLALSHAHALQFLLGREGAEPIQQKHLAHALGLDKSSVARLCARMATSGHLVQERSDADGRARELVLTAKGVRVARLVEAESRSRFERLVSVIPASQRQRVIEALEVLNTAIEALQKEASP